MGVIQGAWDFPGVSAPSLQAVVDALRSRTGLTIECDDDAGPFHVSFPLLRESLFDWQHKPDGISVRSFVPAHPYVWAQLDTVMTEFGATPGKTPPVWVPGPSSDRLLKPWRELTTLQRMVLRLPTVGVWRPFDFLAERADKASTVG